MSISAGAILALLVVSVAPPGARAMRDTIDANLTLDHSQELVEHSSKYSSMQVEDTEQKLATKDACAALVMVHSGEEWMEQGYYRGIYKKTDKEQFARPVYESKELPRRYISYTDVTTRMKMKITPGWVIGNDWEQDPTDGNIGIRFLEGQHKKKYMCPYDVPDGQWLEHYPTRKIKQWAPNKDIVVQAVVADNIPEVPKGPKVEKSFRRSKRLSSKQKLRLEATEDWKIGDTIRATSTFPCTWPEVILRHQDCFIYKDEEGKISEVTNEGDIVGMWRYEYQPGKFVVVEKIVGREHRDKLERTKPVEVPKAVKGSYSTELLPKGGGSRREESPPRLAHYDQVFDQQVCPPRVFLQGCPDWFSGRYDIRQGTDGARPEYQRAEPPHVIVFYDTKGYWVVTENPQNGPLLLAEAPAALCPHDVQPGHWMDYDVASRQWHRNPNIRILDAPQAQHHTRQDHLRSGDHYQQLQLDETQPPLHGGDYQPLIQRDCPAKVYVSGTTHQQKALGLFSIMGGASRSRWPVYQSHTQPEVQYIYFQDTTKTWMVGPNIGTNTCRVRGQVPFGQTCNCPHDVTDWEEFYGYRWVHNRGITVQAVQRRDPRRDELPPLPQAQHHTGRDHLQAVRPQHRDKYQPLQLDKVQSLHGYQPLFQQAPRRVVRQLEPPPQQQLPTMKQRQMSGYGDQRHLPQVTPEEVSRLGPEDLARKGYDRTFVDQAFQRFGRQQDWATKIADQLNGLEVKDDEVIGDSWEDKVQQVMAVTGKSKKEVAQALHRVGGDVERAINKFFG